MTVKLPIGILAVVTLLFNCGAGLQCHECEHAATPGDCHKWTTCGAGEMCFTREFKEADGEQAFHLGCEAASLCTLYEDAHLAGSGDVPCFSCCLNDSCNQHLCTAAVVKPTNPPSQKTCPKFYWEVYNKCYFFGLWEADWFAARDFCKKTMNSDLASFNIQAETDEVSKKLIRLDSPVSGYWLGAFFSPASAEWEWLDRTVFNSNFWERGFPPKMNHSTDYYILQPKPANGRTSKWKTDTREATHGFICETEKV